MIAPVSCSVSDGSPPTAGGVSRRTVGAWFGVGAWMSLAEAVAAAGEPASAVAGNSAAALRSRHVGMNLASLRYWSTQFPFTDLLKNSGGWRSLVEGRWEGDLDLGAGGYPSALAPKQRAVAIVSKVTADVPGTYVVRWDGTGEISFALSRPPHVRSRAPGRIEFDPEVNAALFLAIERTDPNDPVRNVRVFWPGTEHTSARQPFNEMFLSRLAPFSTLRFMGWGSIIGSPVVEWADRAQVSDVNYTTTRGIPIERMIDLANVLQADPWFCIPHQASDDYVRRFAALLLERLDPRLRPHIEYSNEVWNWGFAQTKWAAARSDQLGLPRPFGLPSTFYAHRSVEMFRIVREVWGSAAARVVCVIAGQAAWTQFSESALGWKDTAAQADALAIAPYFRAVAAGDPKQAEANLKLPPEAIIEQSFDSVRRKVKPQMEANAALARKHSLVLKGYEAGSHDTSTRFPRDAQDRMAAVFAAAHRHPGMREVYREYHAHWVEAGGEVLCQYNDIGPWSKWGLWGALERVTQDPASSPKYLGLLDVIAAHPMHNAPARPGR